MTEAKAIVLLCVVTSTLMAVAVLGMAVLGVKGPLLGLGVIIPVIIAGEGAGRIVVHYGKVRRAEAARRPERVSSAQG